MIYTPDPVQTIHNRRYNFIHTFITICRAQCVENVEADALEAVARWSDIGKLGLVSFKVAFQAIE